MTMESDMSMNASYVIERRSNGCTYWWNCAPIDGQWTYDYCLGGVIKFHDRESAERVLSTLITPFWPESFVAVDNF